VVVVAVAVAKEVVVLVLVDGDDDGVGVGVGVFVPAVPAVADIVDNDGIVPMFIIVQQLPTSTLLQQDEKGKNIK
jgi:uncharacterized protein YfaA (DUF2138 family)